ncbi:MAG TPA: hypothetical protein DEQ68_08595 [Ruminococcaceae bacterium]|nr:hypothetical protein [Oscillospiraceae bacterium]
MKKTISAVLAFILISTLSGCESQTVSEESTVKTESSSTASSSTDSGTVSVDNPGELDKSYTIENLDLTNTEIIENTPNSGKWKKYTFKFPDLDKQSAARIVKMADAYGVTVSEDDVELMIFENGEDIFVPFSKYDNYNTDDPENFPFTTALVCNDDIFMEVQAPTGGMIELNNRKNLAKCVLGQRTDIKQVWRPSFSNAKHVAKIEKGDETATCILDGKTVKVADALRNAEKIVSENKKLFPALFSARTKNIDTYSYDNGNQSLTFDIGYSIDGVPLEDSPSLAIEDENGRSYKVYPVTVPAAMLTENSLDWIWFNVIDGTVPLTDEDCELVVSREKACEIVSKKLSQEYKFNVKDIQLMYAAQRVGDGIHSLIEPKWRFSLTGITGQKYSSLYIYVSAIDGDVQISQMMRS